MKVININICEKYMFGMIMLFIIKYWMKYIFLFMELAIEYELFF